jgi:hypothetical protein
MNVDLKARLADFRKPAVDRGFPSGESQVIESKGAGMIEDPIKHRQRKLSPAAMAPFKTMQTMQVTTIGQFNDDAAQFLLPPSLM